MIYPCTGQSFYEEYGSYKILESYTALKIKFDFPTTVQYPNLPVRLDFSSVIFPTSGETFCTGSEFLLAVRLGCKIEIRGGVWIPFSKQKIKTTPKNISRERARDRNNKREPILEEMITSLTKTLSHPQEVNTKRSNGENFKYLQEKLVVGASEVNTQFFSVVEKVLVERIKHPKGSYMNLLYKFIANAGIGQMARGLNQKSRYDLISNSQKPIPSGALVSPLYAG